MKTKKGQNNAILGAAVFLAVLAGLIVGAPSVGAVTAAVVTIEPASQVTTPGTSCCVNITVKDVANLGAYQATLRFDPLAMNVAEIKAGDFLERSGTTVGAGMEIINNVDGSVTFFYALTTYGASVSGSGKLATIYFDTDVPANGNFNLNLSDVILATGTGDSIPVDVVNGSVTLLPFTITLISPENRIYAGTSIQLTVTVEPGGTVLDWLAYSLDGGTTVTTTVNTTINNLSVGDHTLVVYTRDNNDNMATSNTVYFTVHPGDINGDAVVDILDLQLSAWAFGSQPGDANWNEAADLNGDKMITLLDYQIVVGNLGKTYL
jgi:hypothetical protein